MPSYLVETYLPRGGADRAARDARARSAAVELAGEGTDVRFHRSIHLPGDEICFFVFDAATAREVALAAERADLDPLRVIEAVSSGQEQA